MEAQIRFKFRGRWASIRCRVGNVDMILRHFEDDGVTAVKVSYHKWKKYG